MNCEQATARTPLDELSCAIKGLDPTDARVMIEQLTNWETEARYTEADVGVFGSDAMGDALAAFRAVIEECHP